MGPLIHLHLVEKTHLACYKIKDDGTEGCHVCFAAREYAIRNTVGKLDGAISRITTVFTPDCANSSMRVLYHCNCGYAYAEVI